MLRLLLCSVAGRVFLLLAGVWLALIFPSPGHRLIGRLLRVAAAGKLPGVAPLDSSASSWIDSTTGHRVVRISSEPGRGSYNSYFHQNSFTADGDKFVYIHINAGPGQSLWALDLASTTPPGSGKTTHLADAVRLLAFPVVAAKRREVIYLNDHTIYAINLDSIKTRTVAVLPLEWDMSPFSVSGLSINSDETLLAGSDTLGASAIATKVAGTPRQSVIDTVSAAHLPTFLFTVALTSGKIAVIHRGTDWYDHVQFSPRDPSLLMFAHEGPWDKVERTWLIRTDGSGLTSFHPRQFADELCGHEFWAPDGRTIWCAYRAADRSWNLMGRSLTGGQQKLYKLRAQQLSRHYNFSHDGRFFAGDGDVGNPTIQKLDPQSDGTIKDEPLCMSNNDYSDREPNVMLSPDNRWVFFSSTSSGKSEVYAVSVEK